MRRFLLATGLGSLLLAGASAQIELRQDDGQTDFTSRGSVGGGVDGFAIMRHDIWGVQETGQWRTVMQDQNCFTLETWAFVLFGESTANPGTADDTNVIASTGTFLSPGGQPTGACAWIYTVTLTTPLAHGINCAGDGVFVGTFLPSNALWVADGSSTHISIFNAGGSREFPSGQVSGLYPPTTPGAGLAAVYGSEFTLANGGGPGTTYSGSWRIYNRNTLDQGGNGVVYDVRSAAVESPQSAGLYAAQPSIGPANYGMAGKYPDFINDTGTAPVREDDLRYRSNHPSFATGIEQLFIAESTLRCAFGVPPIDIPGQGRFELDPTSVLFNVSGSLHPAQPVAGVNVDHNLSLGATGSTFRNAFSSIPNGVELRVNYQAVRIDLGSGNIAISSMRSWTHRG